MIHAISQTEITSPYLAFTREEWAQLRAATPLTLTEDDLKAIRGVNENLSMAEVEAIHLPITRLLNLYVTATQRRHRVTATFLGRPATKSPFIIGLGGSVAVGKSTTARVLQALLSRWPDHPHVDLVTTDGFLYPNAVLQQKGLLQRKGFPESYDLPRLMTFLRAVRSGEEMATAPLYSHLHYDIVPGADLRVAQPDILILEGLNVLQRSATVEDAPRLFVSDFFDFSLYVDADEDAIKTWFFERFRHLRETAFQNPASYFHRYAELPLDEAMRFAINAWEQINGVNLRENIAPTREHANLILEKGPDHLVQRVRLRNV